MSPELSKRLEELVRELVDSIRSQFATLYMLKPQRLVLRQKADRPLWLLFDRQQLLNRFEDSSELSVALHFQSLQLPCELAVTRNDGAQTDEGADDQDAGVRCNGSAENAGQHDCPVFREYVWGVLQVSASPV